MAVFKFKPRSNEWKEARTKYITATETATLFGLDESKTTRKVLNDKITPPVVKDNIYMRAGRILEPGIFIALHDHGIFAEPADPHYTVFVTNEEARIAASLDGKLTDGKNKYIVECKATSRKKFDGWFENPPINYLLQVQTQLLVTKVNSAILACVCYEFPFPLVAYQIYINKEIAELIKEESKRFWKSYEDGVTYKYNPEYKQFILDNIFNNIELIIQ